MKELFNGILAPITYTIGFLKCDCERAADKYMEWEEPIQRKRGVNLVRSQTAGPLSEVLLHLLPLTSVERRRFLFVPTSGEWTAFFDNGHKGTDAFAVPSYLAQVLGCYALRATAVPNRSDAFGATILELYGPNQTHFLNYMRSVAVAYDGRKWTFSATGEIQPFEQTERYQTRSIKNRFSPEMLDTYLQAMGIRAFAEDFYLPGNSSATLIQKTGPIAPTAREFQCMGSV